MFLHGGQRTYQHQRHDWHIVLIMCASNVQDIHWQLSLQRRKDMYAGAVRVYGIHTNVRRSLRKLYQNGCMRCTTVSAGGVQRVLAGKPQLRLDHELLHWLSRGCPSHDDI